jgi:hypothetical protein
VVGCPPGETPKPDPENRYHFGAETTLAVELLQQIGQNQRTLLEPGGVCVLSNIFGDGIQHCADGISIII